MLPKRWLVVFLTILSAISFASGAKLGEVSEQLRSELNQTSRTRNLERHMNSPSAFEQMSNRSFILQDDPNLRIYERDGELCYLLHPDTSSSGTLRIIGDGALIKPCSDLKQTETVVPEVNRRHLADENAKDSDTEEDKRDKISSIIITGVTVVCVFGVIIVFVIYKIKKTKHTDKIKQYMPSVKLDRQENYFSQTDCVICLADLKTETHHRKISSCGHIFHSECIVEYYKANVKENRSQVCPICKKDIETEEVDIVPTEEGINIALE
ncbi:unnamed protein product [Moneuplotes crassus]|uniref:RING-type domain-containing protein n=1 Tax=Euplotes crassus TaxID=5936 RepID=A0AAD1UA05_EUPCR|nr:unnamed protein product [Moneuplotes crassus]